MFAYCNNNPANMSDKRGTIPFYDDPLVKAIDDFLTWYKGSDENEVDSKGNTTMNARVKRLVKIAVDNLEFSAGVGLGLYRDFEVMDLGFDMGMYGNIGSIHYSDGEWYTGQEIYGGLTGSLIQDYGFSDYTFLQNGQVVEHDSWNYVNSEQRSVTIFSFARYYIAGASLYVGFDVVSFLEDLPYVTE